MENKQFERAIEKALDLAEKTGEFVIEQAPEVLREFYMWQIVSSLLLILLSVALFITGRYLPYLWLSKEKYEWDTKYFGRYGEDDAVFSWALFSISSLVSITILACSIYNLLYIIIAPKMYIIDYFII